MNKDKLLGKLEEFKNCAIIILMKKGLYTKEDAEAYEQIRELIKKSGQVNKGRYK